jgi:RNA polymerase sigma-70 factor (ECF subfamily)
VDSLPINTSLVIALTYHYDGLIDYVRRNFANGRNDHHFAQEIIHDVCISLIDNPPVQRIHTPLAYLRLAIKNRAIDRCRSEEARNRYIDYVAETPDYQHHQDGASALDFSQKLEALKRIIEALPPRQRQVFLLHRLHNMSQQEIANELSISRNMVTQHFTRAITAITFQWQAYIS